MSHDGFHVVIQFSHDVCRRGNIGKEDVLKKSPRANTFCLENLSPCWKNGTKIAAGHPNPRLKDNGSLNFLWLELFFFAFVLCSLRLFMLRTKEQTSPK